MKNFILLLIFNLFIFNAYPQLGMTYEEVIDSFGLIYDDMEESQVGDFYDFGITYSEDGLYDVNNGWSATACLFKKVDDEFICLEVWGGEDRSRINYWITNLRQKNLVEEKPYKSEKGRQVYVWTDYDNYIKHELHVYDTAILYTKFIFFPE